MLDKRAITKFEKLFQDNEYGVDGHTFTRAYEWLIQTLGRDQKISVDAIDKAVKWIMQDVKNGAVYSKDKCPCGCEIDKAGTAIIHAMRARAIGEGLKVEPDKKQESRIKRWFTFRRKVS